MDYVYDTMTLSASSYNNKVTVEIPRDATSDEVFVAFRTLLIGLTYSAQAFDDAVINYYFNNELDKGNV